MYGSEANRTTTRQSQVFNNQQGDNWLLFSHGFNDETDDANLTTKLVSAGVRPYLVNPVRVSYPTPFQMLTQARQLLPGFSSQLGTFRS